MPEGINVLQTQLAEMSHTQITQLRFGPFPFQMTPHVCACVNPQAEPQYFTKKCALTQHTSMRPSDIKRMSLEQWLLQRV